MSLFSKPKGKHAQNAQSKNSNAAEAGKAAAIGVENVAASVEESGVEDEVPEHSGDGDAAGQDAHEEKNEESFEGAEGAAGEAGSENEAVVTPVPNIADSQTEFVAASFGEIPAKKRHRGLKAFGITVGVLAIVALVVYIAVAVVFMGRFLPNTKLGEYDVSLKSDAEVAELLDNISANYRLDIVGGGFAYRMTGAGIGLEIDSAGIIAAMHEDENAWQWPLLIFKSEHDETPRFAVKFNQSAYEDDLKSAIAVFNESAKAPVNATIVYDEANDKFIVKPEEAGTQLDAEVVLKATSTAIDELEPKVVLGEEHLVKPTVLSNDEKLIEAAELATGMVSAHLSLAMGGQPVGEVDGETLSEFITINDSFEVVFKEEEMNAWVDNLAAGYNTVGTERTFMRADGKQVVVPAGGSYGWEIDTEALKNAVLEGIKSGATMQIDIPCIDTAAVYNGVGQRDWGNRYLDVDISEQHVRFYGEDGSIIWEDDCITGMPDGTHDTVPGTWYVNAKESPSKLIGYEHGKKIYETSVTYWMPFEGNGIGFHDATWQPGFGGSMYANGYGSHGCVNLSYGAAKNLYDIIQVGDVVVVHK